MAAELARCQRLCRAKLRQGSRSFFAASRLLPKPVRLAATAVYAFCREADDAIDSIATPAALSGSAYAAALAALNARLDAVYQPPVAMQHSAWLGPVEQALLPVVRNYQLPRGLFTALLEGFCWDAAGRRYASLADLRMYAARVAGSVGVMMALLMGERRAAMLARASDLGVAMQLTNIARDIGEDARAGRIYLPLLWLEEVGLTPAMLQQLAQRQKVWPFASLSQAAAAQALQQVTRRLLRAADVLYGRAEMGIGALPQNCRRSIYAARLIYADIGRCIVAQDFSLQQRAVVPFWRKLYWLWRAAAARHWQVADMAGTLPAAPCLEETAFLVRCAAPTSGDVAC